MSCKKYKDCKNYQIECESCMHSYTDNFMPRELKDNECLCMSCKRIITDDRIFRYKHNLSIGLCFDCY